MAISEACQLWIEQRISEELEDQEETGKSLQTIGRELAAEVEKVFEVKMKPGTLAVKAYRMKAITNVMTPVTPQSDSEISEDSSFLKESSDPPDEPPKTTYGGKREGAGRTMTEKQRKANYNRFWMSVSNQINKLCRRISDKGGFPIPDNAKQETINDLNVALDLINQVLRGVRS